MDHRYIFSILVSLSFLNAATIIDSDPPKPWQRALMARYIIHQSDWISITTISTAKTIKSYPFVNLISMSDGPILQSSGIPYMFMTNYDLSGKDLTVDNRCSALASLAESNYCKNADLDPQDPRCARVILSGKFMAVNNSTAEYQYAEKALFSRHPQMKEWPKRHHFYIGKVEIENIMVLDNFGGVKVIDIQDYFNANLTLLNNEID